MVTRSKILLAEDDLSLGYVIKDSLVEAGYEVVHCPDGKTAIEKFKKENFDICLLDVMMPNQDGFTVLKWIRQQTEQVPVLMITARSMEEDRIHGFESGADDYICKPFSMKELLMRIEVFFRRTKKLYSEKPLKFEIGIFTFLFNEYRLMSGQHVDNITQREAELLLFLCENPNRILTRKEILLQVWGNDDFYLGRSMDVFITKLRKYFKPDPSIFLETIHGTGFKFNAVVK
ncbi:MAG TPA: response regulator transcription factor [Puia sp.]